MKALRTAEENVLKARTPNVGMHEYANILNPGAVRVSRKNVYIVWTLRILKFGTPPIYFSGCVINFVFFPFIIDTISFQKLTNSPRRSVLLIENFQTMQTMTTITEEMKSVMPLQPPGLGGNLPQPMKNISVSWNFENSIFSTNLNFRIATPLFNRRR